MPSLVNFKPVQSQTKIATIKDALNLPAFNAMTQADATTSSSQYCGDPMLGTAFIKAVANDFIKCGGKKIDINFMMEMFGSTPRDVDAKEIYNRYVTDIDHNIYFKDDVTAGGPNTAFSATLVRENHSGGGKYSYPEKHYLIVDKENNIFYSVEDKNVSTDFGHSVSIRPIRADVTGSIKKNKKYLVLPARLVGGNSCHKPTNSFLSIGYAQKVNSFRIRRDYKLEVDLMRGYKDKLRFIIMWDNEGNKIDAWDTFEAQKAREDLQLALNVLAFMGTPITSTDLINGVGATSVDDLHTGFWGYLPTVRYGGGQVIDFDPAVGFDLDGDLEPIILQQDALKRTSRFLVRHGKGFKARLINRTNKMVRKDGLDAFNFHAYERMGEKVKKLGINSYEYLDFNLDFMEWGALTDERLLGGQYFSNLGAAMPMDGIVDGNTGAEMNPIEFYQYGMNETGDYYETVADQREITHCEEITGYCAQSVMMATHCPGQHLLFNPVSGC